MRIFNEEKKTNPESMLNKKKYYMYTCFNEYKYKLCLICLVNQSIFDFILKNKIMMINFWEIEKELFDNYKGDQNET